jgi:glucokinase
MSAYVVAVDIGGTKVAAALVSRDSEISQRLTEPTVQTGPAEGIAQVSRLCQQVITQGEKPVGGVGIGIPAVLEPETDQVIWAPNLSGWRDVALRSSLEAQLGLPVAVEYDGHTAVLGEWWAGAGQGVNTLMSVIVGTGIGGGIVFDGKLLRGRDRLAGAAGWFALTTNPIPDQDRASALGHWESLAAGPGIKRRAQARLAAGADSQLRRLAADAIGPRDIFQAARQGDAFARSIVDETADIIGLGIANVVSLINPDRVVLGGSIGSQGDVLLPRVREVVRRWAQPISGGSVDIVASLLGVDAGILGAAYAAFVRTRYIEGG